MAELRSAEAAPRPRLAPRAVARAILIAVLVIVIAGCGEDEPPGGGEPDAAGARAPDLGAEHIAPKPSDLDAVLQAAPFPVSIPDTAEANIDNLTASYGLGGAVELDFPPPNHASEQLRPPFLSLVERKWNPASTPAGDGDPEAAIRADLRGAQKQGLTDEHACQVEGLPAVCVEPGVASQDGVTDDHAAFVRFIRDNVSFEIVGGDSVDRLLSIAESLRRAP